MRVLSVNLQLQSLKVRNPIMLGFALLLWSTVIMQRSILATEHTR